MSRRRTNATSWGPPQHKAAADAFVAEAYEGSERNPLMPWERYVLVSEDQIVAFELNEDYIPRIFPPFDGPAVALVSMRSSEQRVGHAGRFMKALTELADKRGVALTLTAKGFGDRKIPARSLVAFYKKHGFQMHKGDRASSQGNTMVRYPKRTRTANPASFRRDYDSAAGAHGLEYDSSLDTPSMRRHLRKIARNPGRGRRHWSDAEWAEFAGFNPNAVESFDGTSSRGTYPGVRVDRITGVTVHSRNKVEIDGTRKPLYLIWLKGGRRFRLVGPPSSMRELARDFAQLAEPVRLTRVDYVAPRYPVPEGVRRNKTNREMSIAFTHKVENPTFVSWNGRRDAAKARFDVNVKAPSRRWVNRSGLIF